MLVTIAGTFVTIAGRLALIQGMLPKTLDQIDELPASQLLDAFLVFADHVWIGVVQSQFIQVSIGRCFERVVDPGVFADVDTRVFAIVGLIIETITRSSGASGIAQSCGGRGGCFSLGWRDGGDHAKGGVRPPSHLLFGLR
ncbi:uncharacterized protein BJ171DRAFT_512850 [Polychytrium aggregatum]|uniref:uncharacterized protein n=1 Tax=Polychytrium aggregatum TaxID=110093 RepID=UPI0022FE63DC|nr:uncharacterized protein BJ171DRAFT_512850 [Polychytrium aggregatum]KAI9202658.1 hypothetical protein BJ171DRAFT_512850 [Polychytrium aggregatum]